MSESFDAMSGREAEAMKEEVVRDNVRLMDTAMLELLMTESIGGNAGAVVINGKSYSAAGANAVVDRLSGKIVGFGNMLPVSRDGTQAPIILRVAVDIRHKDGFFRITEVFPGTRRVATRPGIHRDDLLDTHAIDVLQRSIDKWNAARESLSEEDEITRP